MNVNTNIGSSKIAYKDVEIKFPQPFGEIPEELDQTIVVVATIVLDSKFDLTSTADRYSVDVANITKDGFMARVTRLDGDSWDMDLSLNYMANRCTIFAFNKEG